MSRTQRILAFDALRAFAIVTVVAIHTLMPYRKLLPPTAPVRVFDYLLHYAVPLFVFISGVFIWGRPLPAEKGAWRAFLSRRVGVVLIPYVAWSAVYFLVLALYRRPDWLTPRYAVALFLSGHVWYHLYFVPMLLTFYLLTPVASRLSRYSPELLLLACYALRIAVGPEIVSLARATLGEPAGWWATHVVTHLPHMALGGWFAMRQSRMPKQAWVAPILLLGGTLGLLSVEFGWIDAFGGSLVGIAGRIIAPAAMAATVLGLVLGALRVEPFLERHSRPIMTAGMLAFGVYFVHPLFLMVVRDTVTARSADALWLQAWFPLVVFLGVTAASFAVSAALARFASTSRLVGMAKPLRQRA